jgi:dCTP deaminase
MIKICLFGPTGSGKTTIASYIVERYNAELIKIAAPLYRMQNHLYGMIGKDIAGQDGELLQFLAHKIEKEKPQWLAREFIEKVRLSNRHLVVNDDCRLNSYSVLKEDGFVFIRVLTDPETILSRMRQDHTTIDPNHPVEQGFEQFEAAYTVDNNGLLSDTYEQIDTILGSFFNGRYGWLTGTQIHKEVACGGIMIAPFSEDCLNSNSYNYHLSPVIKRITSTIIDCKVPEEYEILEVPEEGLIMNPGECYLGSTIETFGSDVYASLITGRSSVGRKFVTNHVTAGLIDQGFLGNITLEIVVYKPTRIYPSMRFGQIFWFTTYGTPYLYQGKYQGQNGPTLSRLGREIVK